MAGNYSLPPQAAVHLAVQPLSFLLGTWRGQGEGSFPTISPFNYTEEIQFAHSPNKPVIAYSSKTWKMSSGEAMHSESGYWRPKLDGSIEVVIAQSTGLVEVQCNSPWWEDEGRSGRRRGFWRLKGEGTKGTFDAERRSVQLKSALVGNACKVKEINRVFEMVNGELKYVVEMATNLISLQTHLKAVLRKL